MEKTPDFMPSVLQDPDAPIWENPALALALCKAIIDNIIAAFVAMDANGICVEWNRKAEQTFGWTRKEALGKLVADLVIPPGVRPLHTAGIKRYLETGEGPLLDQRIEVNAWRKDGTTFPCTVTIIHLPWNGAPLFAAFAVDISSQKAAMAKLQASYDQVAKEMAERLKAETKVETLEKALEGQTLAPQTEAKLAADRLKEVAGRLQEKFPENK